jgi:hypothetical protein
MRLLTKVVSVEAWLVRSSEDSHCEIVVAGVEC